MQLIKKVIPFILIVFILNICSIAFAFEDNEEAKIETKEGTKLDEIVVTATKTPHLLKDVPVETVVITKEDIERSSAQTISDLVRYTPGIFVRSEDAPGIHDWRTTIRGLSFNDGYGLVLVDGQRVKGGGMGEYGIGVNQVPPQMIERIEIVKGPSSVLYGSDALAGVVNIITKSAPDKPICGFEATYGSHDTNMEYLCWGTKVDSVGILFQASREESDMGAYGYRRNRSESFKRTRLDAKFSYDLNENLMFALKLSGEEHSRKRDYVTKNVVRYTDEIKYRIAPRIKATFSDDSELWIQGYYYNWDFKTKEFGFSGFTPRIGDMYYKNIETRYTRQIKSNHLATVGFEYLQEKLDYNLSKKTLHLTSGYLQDEAEFNIGIPLYVVLGARVDRHSEYGTEFCPKVSFMLEPAEQTKIRGSVGKGFKSPTIRQAYYDAPFQHGNYWFKSNPNLHAETSWGYSLGVEQRFGKRLLFNIGLFRNDVKDKIVRVETAETIDGLPVKTYENVEKAYTQGVEARINLTIIENLLYLDIGHTYLDTENKETGKELTYLPHHYLAGHVIFKHNRLGVTLDVGAQWSDKMYTDTDNTKQTESYLLVDIKVIKKITKNVSISVEGNNIFESDYGEPDRDWWGTTWLARLKMDF